MATQTTHFDMVKQQSAEHVSVGLLNDNFDIIDRVMYDNQEKSEQLADEYNAGTTYNVGDYVRRENYIYKCNTASTTGVWDSTKWNRVKITEELGGGGGSSTLAGLNDVNISSPSTGQALIYNSTTQKWENGAGGGGSSTLAGLTDVSVTGASNKDTLSYNSTSQKWEKSSRLTDLELTVSQMSASTLGITEGHHILKADGTQMAQEEDLQFIGVNVADDNENGKTTVTSAIECTQAQYDDWKLAGTLLTDVDYYITDSEALAIDAAHLPYDNNQSTKEAIDNNILIIETSVNLDYVTNTWSIQATAVPQDFSFPNGYKVISATARTSAPHADKILCDIKETSPNYFYFTTYSSRTETGVPTNIRITLKKS